jgi:hypothetical protein
MLLVDERCLQPDLVGADRIVPVASVAAAEILMLRHQLNVLRRKSPQRLSFSNIDRLVFAALYRLARQAGDRDPLVSCRLPSVLAPEIKLPY